MSLTRWASASGLGDGVDALAKFVQRRLGIERLPRGKKKGDQVRRVALRKVADDVKVAQRGALLGRIGQLWCEG